MDSNTPIRWGAVLAWFPFVASLVTLGVVFGDVKGDVARNSAAIAELKSAQATSADKLTDIRLDVKDIKARFEILVPNAALENGR